MTGTARGKEEEDGLLSTDKMKSLLSCENL